MDHMADMARDEARSVVRRHATLLGPALGLPVQETEERLVALLGQHAREWKDYVNDLGACSFVRKWVR
jgi:hypothetical protein